MPKVESAQVIDLMCACSNLRRATRIVTRIYDEHLKHVGLEITQHSLLTALERAEEVNQKWLSRLFSMDSTTLTRTLARLTKHGWVRSEAGRDRRERVFSLTSAGKRKLAEAKPHWQKAQTELHKVLGEQGWKAMRESIALVTGATVTA